MNCNCGCSCENHEDCSCQDTWCGCIVVNKVRKRKRHHNKVLVTEPMMSLSGFFTGQVCKECGLVGRIDDFFSIHKNVTTSMSEI